jgi:hypothetical protein
VGCRFTELRRVKCPSANWVRIEVWVSSEQRNRDTLSAVCSTSDSGPGTALVPIARCYSKGRASALYARRAFHVHKKPRSSGAEFKQWRRSGSFSDASRETVRAPTSSLLPQPSLRIARRLPRLAFNLPFGRTISATQLSEMQHSVANRGCATYSGIGWICVSADGVTANGFMSSQPLEATNAATTNASIAIVRNTAPWPKRHLRTSLASSDEWTGSIPLAFLPRDPRRWNFRTLPVGFRLTPLLCGDRPSRLVLHNAREFVFPSRDLPKSRH